MWLFRKKNKKERDLQDQWAHRIAGVIIQKQQLLSKVISGILGVVPVMRLKFFLIVFCMVGSAVSGYLLTAALNDRSTHNSSFPIDQLQRPAHAQMRKRVLLQQPTVRNDEIDRISNIKRYLDSLSRDHRGKKLYNSLLLAHPSLMDSIRQLEAIYLQQYKK